MVALHSRATESLSLLPTATACFRHGTYSSVAKQRSPATGVTGADLWPSILTNKPCDNGQCSFGALTTRWLAKGCTDGGTALTESTAVHDERGDQGPWADGDDERRLSRQSPVRQPYSSSLAACAAACPASVVTKVLKLVISESEAYSPVPAAVRGEVSSAAVV